MTTMVIMDHDDEDENDEKKVSFILSEALSLSLSLSEVARIVRKQHYNFVLSMMILPIIFLL